MKVLLIILAVLALLLYLPVGVDVGYTGGQVLLRVRAGALAFTVLPRKAGKKKSKKPKKQSTAEQKSGQPKEKRKLPVTKDDILDAAELLDARTHPEKYQDLQVRLCGWNEYWIHMEPVKQDAFLKRLQAN